MKRVFVALLFASLMGDDCDDKPTPKVGEVGMNCYDNGTCNDALICVRWEDRGGKAQSVCTDPKTLNVGGFLVPKTCETPDMSCTPCEAGWKRGAR